jgi:hypothetical protein|tara:strand:+ start:2143 stop:2313 length:171 start_codon:yes stop_codon:yes gene_type:complete
LAFGIQIADLCLLVVRPVLHHIDFWSEAAEELVIETALTENYPVDMLFIDTGASSI